jgi:hypothetical protein
MSAGAMGLGFNRLLMGIAVWAVAMACAAPGKDGGSPAASPSPKGSQATDPSPKALSSPSSTQSYIPAAPLTASPKADSAGPIPDFRVELQGQILSVSGKDSIFMTLASDAQRLSGSLRIGKEKPSRITEAKLTALTKPSWDPAVHARFRLDFAVDGCEHVAAMPPAATYQWGPCFYYAEDRKPIYPQWGEAWVDLNGIPKMILVTVAGTNDVSNLSGVFRMTGVAKK